MKILWLANGPIPLASNAFKIDKTNVEGWKILIFEKLMNEESIETFYIFPLSISSKIKCEKTEKTSFIAFNSDLSLDDKILTFQDYIEKIAPDIIHIWGTEYVHTYAMTEATKKLGISNRVVISIQGLVSMYAYHYMGNIPAEVQNSITFRDFVKKDSLKLQQRKFEDRGYFEQEAIKNVKHIIGRTFWDKACTELINPNRIYHFNNETLRKSFYQNRWDINEIEKHSIFVSQSYYPIKGFHNVLIAANYIKERYPDLKIYVSGANNAFITGIKTQAYGKYVQSLIEEYDLKENVVYLGSLNEEEMVKRYLKSNVFVSASSIENSPNSVGEAMILGVPVISSNVGGVSDLLKHNEEGYLYQADAPYMLAYYLNQLFDNEELQVHLGKKAREHALKTHDFETNYNKLLEIYEEIGEMNDNQ